MREVAAREAVGAVSRAAAATKAREEAVAAAEAAAVATAKADALERAMAESGEGGNSWAAGPSEGSNAVPCETVHGTRSAVTGRVMSGW